MKSNTEWKYWGKEDPMYGVAAWAGRDRKGHNPWTHDEFFALGASDWADFLGRWRQYGIRSGLCVEIGCGAGRLTAAMADFFDTIKALDISDSMIRVAMEQAGKDNIEYLQVSGAEIPTQPDSVDGVFSTHVFQHFDDVDDGRSYFEEIHRVLRPGGSMMIHLPLIAWPGGTSSWIRLPFQLARLKSNIVAHIKRRLLAAGRQVSLMRMTSYEVNWLFSTLDRIGFEHIEVSMLRTRSNGAMHPFVLARTGGGDGGNAKAG